MARTRTSGGILRHRRQPHGHRQGGVLNVDRTVVVNGSISINDACTITMSNEATVRAPAVPS